MRESHRDCGRVQDAYSLRCMPQVHGAARDALDYVARVHLVEMNSATDNPMVFADTGEILSGGNFHGQPVAIAADLLAIAAADLGAISERRTERLVNPSLSGLPAFLAREGGLHSGLMMAHVTAAALASESKTLAHPASVDSIPTSAGKEDHVSMGPTAAWKAARVVANTGRVLAVELLAACEALDFRRPLRSSRAARGRARTGAASACPPTGRTASSGPRSRPSPTSCGRERSRTRPSRPAVRWSRCPSSPASDGHPGSAEPCCWLSPPASSRRWRYALGPRRWPLLVGLAAGLILLLGGLERLWQRRPLPRRHRAADRTRFRVVPGGKGNGHAHDAGKDDDGDKPRWVM